MNITQRRAQGKAAQSRVFNAHWGYGESDDEAAVFRQAPRPSPIIAKLDLDQTLLDGISLFGLEDGEEEKLVEDRKVHVTILKAFKEFQHGSSSISAPQLLKTYIKNALEQQHGHECATVFEREVAVWTKTVEVTLPGSGDTTRDVMVTIPMVSVKAGTIVYAKLPLELDQAFLAARELKGSLVQHNCSDTWRAYFKDPRNEDDNRQYVVMKLADRVTDLVDALFHVKVASEMAAGSSTEQATQASGEELINTLLRVATRNGQVGYITAALAALDPEERVLRDKKAVSCGKPTRCMGGNIFDHKRETQFSDSVVVGLDNNRWEMLLPVRDDHLSGLASVSYAGHVEEVTLAGAGGSVNLMLVTLERAAKAAGVGALDLFTSCDKRPLQQRQLSGLSSTDSRQLAATGIRRNMQAAAAAAGLHEPAAAAAGGHQGPPAAPAVASSPIASSPMAVDCSPPAAVNTATASQAAVKHDRELTPPEEISPTTAAVPKTARNAAAGTSRQQWRAAAVARSSSGTQTLEAAGSRHQMAVAGGSSSARQQAIAASRSSSGRQQLAAAVGSSSTGGVQQVAAAAGGSSNGRQPMVAAPGGSSSGRQPMTAALPGSSSSSRGGGGAAASLQQQFDDAAALPTSPAAAAAALPSLRGNLAGRELGILNSIYRDRSAAAKYRSDLDRLTQEGFILVSPAVEQCKPSQDPERYELMQLVAIGRRAIQRLQMVLQGAQQGQLAKALQQLQTIKPKLNGQGFAHKYTAAQQQGHCLLLEARKLFKVKVAPIDGSRRQCDETGSLINSSADRWQREDERSRQLALDARVGAIVCLVLEGHPQLPQGLHLFAVEPENPTTENSSTSVRGEVSAAARRMGMARMS